MAELLPFRGILYNAAKIDNLAEVVTPPYDVITDQECRDYHARHPYNIIRLILGNTDETEMPSGRWHARALNYFHSWLSDGILVRDKQPAVYLTSLEFGSEAGRITRHGLIGLVRLEPFEKGVILPHEKTFTSVKSERLSLMKTCHANFSPIFALYPDKHNSILETLKTDISGRSPDIDFLDNDVQRHRLWRITDPQHQRLISEKMTGKTLFIADGHHRYETALNYRQWVKNRLPAFSDDHPANFIMMYLSGMEDPGLMIRAAHRLIKGVDTASRPVFLERSKPYFDILNYPFRGNSEKAALSSLMTALHAHAAGTAIGVYWHKSPCFHLFLLKPEIMRKTFGGLLADALLDLDVVVLTQLILMKIIGFNPEHVGNEKRIDYTTREEKAVEAVKNGAGDIAFILNPTRIDQVRRVAEEGLFMPGKATYFYPKVTTGLVVNTLRPDFY